MVVALGQLTYASVTSRSIEDEVFGAFAVAMSATGLVALFMTTGLATFALAADSMSRDNARAIKSIAWAAGILTALVVWVGADLWVAVWAGTSEAAIMLRLLCVQVLLNAPAAVSVALLRRQARPKADALVQVVSVIVGLGVGLACIALTGVGVTLVVAPTVTAIVTLVLSSALAHRRYEQGESQRIKTVLGFAWRVSNQNLVFFLLMSLPVWAVSRGAGPEELGQFSRALVLTQTPALAMTGAIVRAVQPFFRLAEGERRSASVTDAISLSAWVAFPLFFGLAACARPTVEIVLGRGWDETAQMVIPLAVGYGLYVVFSVAASAGQTLGAVRQVTLAQSVMLPICVSLSALSIYANSSVAAAIAYPAMMGVGIVFMLYGLGTRGIASFAHGLRSVALHMGAAAVAATVAVAAGRLVGGASMSSGVILLWSVLAGFLAWLLMAWALPGGRILRRRQVFARA
ncbi:hypothetical protein GCM10009623_13080 [Nocardioides aestuarii]